MYHNLVNLKPLFNFWHVLKINKDVLSTFGALHLRTEIIELEYCCKRSKIDGNQPKPVPNIGL